MHWFRMDERLDILYHKRIRSFFLTIHRKSGLFFWLLQPFTLYQRQGDVNAVTKTKEEGEENASVRKEMEQTACLRIGTRRDRRWLDPRFGKQR